MAEDQDQRTFEPTEQRREKFAKEGRHPQARDLGGLAATAVTFGALVAARGSLARGAHVLFARTLGDLGALDRFGVAAIAREVGPPLASEIVPVLFAASVVAVCLGAAQARFRLNVDALSIKWERLDPAAGFGRVFALSKNGVGLLLSIARLALVGGVAYEALSRELSTLLAISAAPTGAAVATAAGAIGRVVASALVALVVVAAADYAYSWFSLEREMKMTRQERIDEAKREEGDPKLKAKMKARARALSRKRALDGVKTADVIVTNPTHVAVALRYGDRDPAPVVVAKGHDELALRIRAEARKHGIPVLENRPLARALDAQASVGRPIPQAHFAAVAQVLAFIYRLKKKGAFGGMTRA
jgi:flagellar biosynthetic protein FlhB